MPTQIPVSVISRALESVWTAIQARHPEVPHAVVTLATNAGRSKTGSITAGHWSATRWMVPDEGSRAEVVIAGEILGGNAARMLEVLLHEAAHGLAHARNVKDTSNRNRYHNKRFKKLAEELGLDVTEHATLGWQNTTLRAATRVQYAEQIAVLAEAQQATQRVFRVLPKSRLTAVAPSDEEEEATPQATRVALTCSCAVPRRLWIAPGVASQGEIVCGVCESAFAQAALASRRVCSARLRT